MSEYSRILRRADRDTDLLLQEVQPASQERSTCHVEADPYSECEQCPSSVDLVTEEVLDRCRAHGSDGLLLHGDGVLDYRQSSTDNGLILQTVQPSENFGSFIRSASLDQVDGRSRNEKQSTNGDDGEDPSINESHQRRT